MSTNKNRLIMPTDAEDKLATQHAIEDESLLTDDQMKSMRPVGRPKLLNPKQPVTIRLDADVLTYFKKTGKGWQTKVNDILNDYVKKQA